MTQQEKDEITDLITDLTDAKFKLILNALKLINKDAEAIKSSLEKMNSDLEEIRSTLFPLK